MIPLSRVASWFSCLADRDGQTLDPPRLQALACIAQGFAVALYYEPLFAAPIEAGEQGPIIRGLSARDCRERPLDAGPPPTHGVGSVVEYVHQQFGDWSTDRLAATARDGTAWRNALAGGVGATLSFDDLCADYSPLVRNTAGEPLEPISQGQAMEVLRAHPELLRKTRVGRAQLDAGRGVPHPPIRW